MDLSSEIPEIELSRKSSEALPSMNDLRSLSRLKSHSFNYSPAKPRSLMRTRTQAFRDDERTPTSPQLPVLQADSSMWSKESARLKSKFQSGVSDEVLKLQETTL